MQCPKCGNEVRPNSQFCHHCASPIRVVNPERGGNFIRIAFVLFGILPTVAVVFETVAAILAKKFSLLTMFNIFLAVSILTLFVLIYRGHQWAIYPIGLILVISSLAKDVLLVMVLPFNAFSVFGLLFSVLYIVFGIFLMKSKDILAFIKNRAKVAG